MIHIYIYTHNICIYTYIYIYISRSMTLDDLRISSKLPMAHHDLPGEICQSFSGNFAFSKHIPGAMAKSVRKKRNAMKVSQKVKEGKHMRHWDRKERFL